MKKEINSYNNKHIQQNMNVLNETFSHLCPRCKSELNLIFIELNRMVSMIQRNLNTNPENIFFDNQEFCQIMHISKRTAQNWRNAGVIKFSAIGNKFYYKLSDILILLDKFKN